MTSPTTSKLNFCVRIDAGAPNPNATMPEIEHFSQEYIHKAEIEI